MAATKNAQLAKLALGIVGAAALAGITGRLSESSTAKSDGAVAAVPSLKEASVAPDDDAWWRLKDHDDDDHDEHKRKHESPTSAIRAPRNRNSAELPPTRSGHS